MVFRERGFKGTNVAATCMNIFVRVFTNLSATVNCAMKVFLTKCASHFIKPPVLDLAG